MSFLRSILWLVACVLIWVFAHDYVASHINKRIDNQMTLGQSGDLNFSWDVSRAEDVVTVFDSVFDGQHFQGKQLAVSLQMPSWPLMPQYYQQFSLHVETVPRSSFSVALETSEPEQGHFYTARMRLNSGKHEVDLTALDWVNTSGKLVDWSDIPQATTWVVRLFAKEALIWDIKDLSLPQTKVFGLDDWQPQSCENVSQPGQWLADCLSSNKMVQFDQQINQQSIDLTIKFKSWLADYHVLMGLLAIVLMLLVFWGRGIVQCAVLGVSATVALMLYVPIPIQWMNGHILLALVTVLALWFVFYHHRKRWLVSQKGSVLTWFFVAFVAFLLWWEGDFSLSFLPLFPAYFLWAAFQQTLMVSLYEWFKSKDAADSSLLVFVAWSFAMLHMPNHYLMLLTFIGGVFWMLVWYRTQNLLLMVVSHSLWALLLYQSVGEVWLHSARVGYNFL